MIKKIALRNEVVKIKGRVKAITIKKEDFNKFLKLTKLRVLDKTYDALMPPIDDMKKNTIDVNGLAQLVQANFAGLTFGSGSNTQPGQAQMVLTTSSGTIISLPYTNNISQNSQGVTVFMQVFEQNNNYNFQYYYVGFDTTNDSYTTSQAELYVSSIVQGNTATIYSPLVRIAYSSIGLTKTSSEYLFIVWLIAFENVPPYLTYFTPIFQNNIGIVPQYVGSGYTVYFNNGNCNFTCGGNCPSSGNNGFITYIQNNNVILEIPLQAPLNTGVSNLEVLLCATTGYSNLPTISGSTSTTVTPPVSGATIYVAIATITITYTGS